MKPLASILNLVATVFAAALLCFPLASSTGKTSLVNTPIFSESCDNPLCNCQSCDCEDCSCTPITTFEPLTEPLQVGPPPDSIVLTALKSGGELFTEPQPVKFTEPQKPAPKPVPVAKAAPVAAGHYQTVYAGLRGRRSYQVWVPNAPTATCTNGSCSSSTIANGALPGYWGYGGCRSCR